MNSEKRMTQREKIVWIALVAALFVLTTEGDQLGPNLRMVPLLIFIMVLISFCMYRELRPTSQAQAVSKISPEIYRSIASLFMVVVFGLMFYRQTSLQHVMPGGIWVLGGLVLSILTMILGFAIGWKRLARGEVVEDEREQQIKTRASVIAGRMLYLTLAFSCVGVIGICEGKDSIPVDTSLIPLLAFVPMVLYSALESVAYIILRRQGGRCAK